MGLNDSKVAQDTAWKKQRLTGRASHLIEEAVGFSKGNDPPGPSLAGPGHGRKFIHDQAYPDPYH
jgi:hypothetical protein